MVLKEYLSSGLRLPWFSLVVYYSSSLSSIFPHCDLYKHPATDCIFDFVHHSSPTFSRSLFAQSSLRNFGLFRLLSFTFWTSALVAIFTSQSLFMDCPFQYTSHHLFLKYFLHSNLHSLQCSFRARLTSAITAPSCFRRCAYFPVVTCEYNSLLTILHNKTYLVNLS